MCLFFLLSKFLGGHNITILCYGQTGSGKTFTMLGEGDNIGIAPRVIKQVFDYDEKDDTVAARMWLSAVEIYNDNLTDLIRRKTNGKAQPIRIMQDRKGNITYDGYKAQWENDE
jgi:hypothetical protein